MLIPRLPVPDLDVPSLGGGRFRLSAEAPERFSLVCFYRGYHCPICLTYLKELDRLTPEFAKRGVTTIAVSSDTAERARMMADKVGAEHLRFAYDLPLGLARDWGLSLSTSRGTSTNGVEEPAIFSEPGLFLIRPDMTLYYGSVQTMPFVRPPFKEMVAAVDFVVSRDYPARGEYTGPV